MSTINDIKPIIGVNLWLLSLSILLIILVIAWWIYYAKRLKRIQDQSSNNDQPKIVVKRRSKSEIKKDFILQIEELKQYLVKFPNEGSIILFRLSQILRGFIEEYYEIKALSRNKTELQEQHIEELNKVLMYSYEVQFAFHIVAPQLIVEMVNLVHSYIYNAT